MNDSLLNDQVDEPKIDDGKDYLAELTAPGGKFDKSKYSSELEAYKAIAKGKVYADQMIEIKNLRDDELRKDFLKVREENVAKAKLEELIDQLKQERLASSEHTQAKEDEKKPMVDPEQIRSLVTETYRKQIADDREAANFNAVQAKLNERFGTNYQASLKKQIETVGLTVDEANALARRSPEAFYRTFGLNETPKQDAFDTLPRSSQRRDTFAPTASQDRKWSYYQELKKKDPELYYDPKIANQMMEDHMRMGETFRDGDYYVKGLHEQ